MRVSRRTEPATPRSPGRGQGGGGAALAGILVVVAGLAALAVGWPGIRSAVLRHTGESGDAAAASALVMAPVRLARALAAGTRVPRILLDVKFKHLHELHEKRDEALRSGVLETSDADFVPVDANVDGVTIPARIRFDGGRIEPLRGDKWPFVVHSRGDGQVLGMRRFTLRAPEVPAFGGEQPLLDHARSEDVVSVRTTLVDLTLNGRHLGLMEIADLPSRELLESQRRRDGPVLRFEEPPLLDWAPADDDAAIASVLRPDAIAASRKLSRQRDTALRLLRAALSGSLAPGDVFDPVLFGRFIALADLWEAPHVLAWPNLLLYANPLTARFEPLAHPCSPPKGSEVPAEADVASFRTWLLSDPRIRAAYGAERSRIAREMAADSFAGALREGVAARTRVLHREDPLRAPFDPTALLAGVAQREGMPEDLGELRPGIPGADGGDPGLPLPTPGLDEVLGRHAFLRFEPGERMLLAAPGRWQVADWLILPEGVGLRLPAGTTLHFEKRRGIIARGPLEFLGTSEAPVVLDGPPDRGGSPAWAGVYVVESTRPSRWTHVTVRNTAGFRRRGWRLAGGVVFRKAGIEIEDSTFRRSGGDDSLNVIRSTFSLRNVTIVDSTWDAFDGDYADGEISGGVIGGAGGDAIDVGGSRLVVRGVRIENVRDKAIVVGERSHAAIEGVTIEHASVGVASKNGSETALRSSSIDAIGDVALMAYTNHAEYGPGLLTADGNRITRAALPALAQSGSRITIDGELVPPVDAAIDRLYKDGETDR